jgi:RecA/RadA recombinase
MITAAELYQQLQRNTPLSSGDSTLDPLLQGGFQTGLVHVLTGPAAYTASILMRTAVNALRPRVDGGAEFSKIAYVDGQNLFNPYYIAKLSISFQLNPTVVLDQIVVARAFTWNQIVEILEEKIPRLGDVQLILVAGLTEMFEEATQDVSQIKRRPANNITTADQSAAPSDTFALNPRVFQDMHRMILGLKEQMKRSHPIIILTGPFHSKSLNRPAGGQLLAHFAHVIVGIHDHPRFIRYTLDQHPFLSYRESKYWKTLEMQDVPRSKHLLGKDPRNLTLDSFVHPLTAQMQQKEVGE